jgi:hypothetical protein
MGISFVDVATLPQIKKRLNSEEDEVDQEDQKPNRTQSTVCIITEYLEQGSLADILYGPTKLPSEIWSYELILTCALQAARGNFT